MHNVDFHRLALRELVGASAWYRERSEQARVRFRNAVFDAVERIATDPHAHVVLASPYRSVRVRRFPYVLIYEILDDKRVLIVAVAHTSRRPGYWRRRK
jgi:toxin ParE1/3/4